MKRTPPRPTEPSTKTTAESRYAAILAVVARIPRGRVASYGQIAALAGLPKQARLVGYALHHAGDTAKLPWHRVVNSAGRLSFPIDSEPYRQQKTRLASEGIPLLAGRIDLRRYRWQPASLAPVRD